MISNIYLMSNTYTHKMLSISSMPDHLHFFFGFRPDQSMIPGIFLNHWNKRYRHFAPSGAKSLSGYFGYQYFAPNGAKSRREISATDILLQRSKADKTNFIVN
ncbi:MAG TPA: hypothetical protein VEV87_04560 [Chitinophagaceae bacterium]|nr:hypothetical protein [Chitinophagaceae bacterium]